MHDSLKFDIQIIFLKESKMEIPGHLSPWQLKINEFASIIQILNCNQRISTFL